MKSHTEAEAEAKAKWDALTPEPDTILWYEKWFADNTMDIPSLNSGVHYQTLIAVLNEWAQERTGWGTEESWLESYREQYAEALADNAEFDKRVAAEIAAKNAEQAALRAKLAAKGFGTGHAILRRFYGGNDRPPLNILIR